MTEAKEKMKRLISDIWKIVSKKLLSMEIKDTGIITITEKVQVITVNDWLKFSDDELSDYLNRELEYTDRGQLKSNTTNLITVLVNPLFCKEEKIYDERVRPAAESAGDGSAEVLHPPEKRFQGIQGRNQR